ncbi:MAG TPA: Gfo/Idh/MocA family oxidoreductase [Candidatus Methylomirabilis sp.]|nr:Gfo/Idh/MocA family oxidoreductase [Candidatus Methylomirabilis sp.]
MLIRVGIVGCGRMGEIHLRIVREVKGVEVVGVADTDVSRANAFAAKEKIGVAAGDLGSLMERSRPDAVHIVTPPATHASLACMALRAGCHVFVEKPMALTAQDAGLVVAAAKQGPILTVGHNHLFDPAIREACARVAQGRLGQLIGLDAFHGALPGLPGWLAELPYGPWMEDAPHPLYLSQLFMGDPLAVRAIGHPSSEGSKFKEVRVVTQHAGGVSSLTFSEATVPYRHRLTLFGTKRTLEIDLVAGSLVENRPITGHRWLAKGLANLDAASQLLLATGRNAARVLMRREQSWPGLRALIEAFYAAIRAGGPSPVPATQGVHVAKLLDEIGRLLTAAPNGLQG